MGWLELPQIIKQQRRWLRNSDANVKGQGFNVQDADVSFCTCYKLITIHSTSKLQTVWLVLTTLFRGQDVGLKLGLG